MNMHDNHTNAPDFDDIRGDIFSNLDRLRSSVEERGPYLSFGIVLLALLSFGIIIWVAYPHGQGGDTSLSAVPLIRADTTPLRRAPDDPGGMSIPFQDSTVFDRLEEGAPAANNVENLLEVAPAAEDNVPVESAAKPEDVSFEGAKNIMIKEETAADADKQAAVEYIPPKPAVKPDRALNTAAKPAAAQPASSAAAAGGGVYIQLGSLGSREAAVNEWARLQKKFPQALSGLSLDIQRADLGAKGVYYRVRGGMLPVAQARDICARLKNDNPGGCILVEQ